MTNNNRMSAAANMVFMILALTHQPFLVVDSFQVVRVLKTTSKPIHIFGANTNQRIQSLLILSASTKEEEDSGSSSSSTQQRRRKRKVEPSSGASTTTEGKATAVETTSAAAPTAAPVAATSKPTTVQQLKPRNDAKVTVQVQDVRNLVGGGASVGVGGGASSSSRSSASTAASDQKPSIASAATRTTQPLPNSIASNSNTQNSLEQLLEDARRMQQEERALKKKGSSSGGDERDEDETDEPGSSMSIPQTLKSVLSTIVTADFFVVCGFLLWFLAGIFASYVLKDDGIQIAFNSNFERLVQPALGILMIGSLAGALTKEEDDE